MAFPAAERLARVRLIRTHRVGPVAFRQLIARHGSATIALDALAAQGQAICPAEIAEAEIAAAQRVGAIHIYLGETDYPPLLAQTSDAPPVLVAVGNLALAGGKTVGIVGARNASAAGLRLTEELAAALGAAGWVVVSGLARGVDGSAHMGALATGTIACVAGGVDIFYPPDHEKLQRQIAERGLILSEMPCGTEPMAQHFPRRNRLIAGLSRGLLVIEAAMGSGSLITARLAGEAGREVMAIPGHPRDPRARGCNGLIKEGAILVEDVPDILAALDPFTVNDIGPRPARRFSVREGMAPAEFGAETMADESDRPDAATLLAGLLSAAPVPVDELIRRSGLPTHEVHATLVDLELDGRLVRHAGGRVAMASDEVDI